MHLRQFTSLIAVLSAGLVCSALYGCGNDSGMTPDQAKTAQNIDEMTKASNGDWNKLTPDQQKTLTAELGTESAAKTLLQMKAHPPAPIAPGRPDGVGKGGPPPGANQRPPGQ